MKEEANEALKFLENEIKGKKYFGGDNIGAVDIAANFVAYWVPIISDLVGIELVTEEKFSNLYRWVNDYCANSLVQENLPTKDSMVAIFKHFL